MHLTGFPFLLIGFSLPFGAIGQTVLAFEEPISPPEVVDSSGQLLHLAWTGGFNQPQFGAMDWNGDGFQDIWSFDRCGNTVVPLVYDLALGLFRHRPDLKPNLPLLRNWTLSADYNLDGKMDLLGYNINGLQAYKNVAAQGQAATWLPYGQPLKTDFGLGDAVFFISQSDIPGLADVDGDGDLDVLTFNFLGSCLEWHKNLSMERFGHADSLIFQLESAHWGNFSEGNNLDQLQLQDSCQENGGLRHSGSATLAMDFNADGLTDLVLGDAGENRLAILLNGGSPQQAQMVFAQAGFPGGFGTSFFALEQFPAAYAVDVNQDGRKDLLVAPNSDEDALDAHQVFAFYQQTSPNPPLFQASTQDFFYQQILDLGTGCHPAAGDLNGDGLPEIWLGSSSLNGQAPQWHYLESYFNGTAPAFRLAAFHTENFNPPLFDLSPELVDLDGDGDLDLVFGCRSGKVFWIENTGNAQQHLFVVPEQELITPIASGYTAPALFDLNQDGFPELVVGSANGKLSYFPHNGSSTPPFYAPLPADNQWGGVDVTDPLSGNMGYAVPEFFQGDQGPELLVGAYRGTIWHFQNLLLGNGQPASNFQLVTQSAGFVDVGWHAAPTHLDWNGDGFLDLVVGNARGGLQFFLGKQGDLGNPPDLKSETGVGLFPNPISLEKSPNWNGAYPEHWFCFDLSGRLLAEGKGWQPERLRSIPAGTFLFRWINSEGKTGVQRWVRVP